MSILSLIVLLILVGLAFWAVNQLSAAFGIPQPIVTVIWVLLVIIVVIYLLQAIGGLNGGPVLRLQ
jgi:hypothetical protein